MKFVPTFLLSVAAGAELASYQIEGNTLALVGALLMIAAGVLMLRALDN